MLHPVPALVAAALTALTGAAFTLTDRTLLPRALNHLAQPTKPPPEIETTEKPTASEPQSAGGVTAAGGVPAAEEAPRGPDAPGEAAVPGEAAEPVDAEAPGAGGAPGGAGVLGEGEALGKGGVGAGGVVEVRVAGVVVVGGAAVGVGVAALGVGWSAALPAYVWLALAAVGLTVVDLATHRLPNRIVYPTYAAGLVLLGAAALADGAGHAYVRALIAMAALYTAFLLAALAFPNALGFGDVKLAGVLGLYLGYLGGGILALGLALGLLIGFLAALALLLARRVGWHGELAYGPSLLAGALIAVGAGQPLWDAYTNAAGL